jgi:hypothetical protein
VSDLRSKALTVAEADSAIYVDFEEAQAEQAHAWQPDGLSESCY